MRLSSGWTITLLLVLFLGFLLRTLPTTKSAGISGSVFDDSGPVGGVRVRVKGTALTTRTNEQGLFHLPSLSPGQRVTAWKEGYLIGGSLLNHSPVIHLARMPEQDNDAYEWVDPTPNAAEIHNCANCHAEIYREWSQSAHSRSVNGRHFRNLYEGTDWHGNADGGWGLLTQYPEGAGVCASCHAPASNEYDLRQVRGVATRGVHCDYCHKIAGVADGELGLSHGRFNLRLLRPNEGQLFFGALDDVDRGEDVYSPLYRDSRYCASCHEGIVFGVHVYSTFSEWQASPARRQGKQCQDCHMKPTGHMTNMAPGHGGIPRDPRTLANHRFFDGDQESMLRKAVKASVDFECTADGVRARVRVWAEGVGHRLPTGFVDRHLVLVVEGNSERGQPVLARSGPKLPAFAGEEGQSGRLYARVLRDFDGNGPVPFWLASSDPPSDTRLQPGKVEETEFTFPATLARLHLRILYRRFWPDVALHKKWPDRSVLVLDREFPASEE